MFCYLALCHYQAYGTRRQQAALRMQGITLSRRRIVIGFSPLKNFLYICLHPSIARTGI
ncbi:hypothetical protein [Gilliamella sp. Pas-s25]|uniref:hypothetical protein n=1 Tax=Gilliamella sp. Pas-s25 TaxID=2687310 RepID=UPI00135E230B|nr:hypothetical protein [Gilliamella sp. Pas-s25]MWP61147.1 hypothetical protein [Gilliamella sp. Pas-s25]